MKAEKQTITKEDVTTIDAASLKPKEPTLEEQHEAAKKKRLADIEARRVAPALVARNEANTGDIPVTLRFYQADDASEAPGAWYAAAPGQPDARLDDVDHAALHKLAEKILGKGKS